MYPDDRVQAALENFFKENNLTRLRELALEEIAHRLDTRRRERAEAGDAQVSERVMVCLSSRSPDAHALLRKGARLADRLGAPWYAVYIQTPRERIEKIDAATHRRIGDTLTLAQQLGGVPQTWISPDLPKGVASFVQEYGITHIVLGRSRQPWYRRWFGRGVLDRLLQAIPGVDVLIVDHQ